MKIKELLKNKKFVIVLGIVGIVALVMFMTKNKTSTDTAAADVASDEYGNDSGYSGGENSSNVTESTTPTTIVNTDNVGQQPVNQVETIDVNQYKQDVSNKIYDLKELWTKTNKEFGNNPTTEQKEVLTNIHKEAEALASSAGFTDISTNKSGIYQGMYTDTNKNYNAYTGDKQTTKGIEKTTTDELKEKRIQAQKEILDLKNKYALTSDKAEKAKIHTQAETIGVIAGLGSGGKSGTARREVDLKTGEIIN